MQLSQDAKGHSRNENVSPSVMFSPEQTTQRWRKSCSNAKRAKTSPKTHVVQNMHSSSGTATPQSPSGITIDLHAEIRPSDGTSGRVHVFHFMSYYHFYLSFSNLPLACSVVDATCSRAHTEFPFPLLIPTRCSCFTAIFPSQYAVVLQDATGSAHRKTPTFPKSSTPSYEFEIAS